MRVVGYVDDVDRIDRGMRWAAPQVVMKTANDVGIPFGGDFHGTVRAVLHPPGEIELDSLLSHEPTEADALHAAANDHVQARYFSVFAHP